MKVKLAVLGAEVEKWLPENEPDGSGIGANYVDACLKAMAATLDDGSKVACKRRGLKIRVEVGERRGEAIIRRLEHGPDVKDMFHAALREAFAAAGVDCTVEGGGVFLEY